MAVHSDVKKRFAVDGIAMTKGAISVISSLPVVTSEMSPGQKISSLDLLSLEGVCLKLHARLHTQKLVIDVSTMLRFLHV